MDAGLLIASSPLTSNPTFGSELNPAQQQAVTCGEGPLLIVAGAGTGKTRVLTHRIANLIHSGVKAFQILAVTFTNKAAGEMRERVMKLVDQEVWVATFHATGLKILRLDGPRIGIPKNFLVFDETDQLVLIKECMEELGFNPKHFNPKGLREEISHAKDDLKEPTDIQPSYEGRHEDILPKVYSLYERKLRTLGGLDFGDLILKPVKLFREHADILAGYQERFRYILIDEYQDTNRAQYHLVNLLAARYKNLTVVGDPDQSIYAWRGADIRNILDFETDYPDCRHIVLEENYRSTTRILDAANHLIIRNIGRKPKALWSSKGEGEKLSLYEARDEKDEAAFIVREILELKGKGHSLKEMVIFYRVHAQSRVFEDLFRRNQLPYRIIGGVRFYDRREVKDLMSYLRVLVNPANDVGLRRIINVPSRGLGKKTLELLTAYQQTAGTSFLGALQNVRSIAGILPRARETILKFLDLLEGLKKRRFEITLSEFVEEVLDRTGMIEELRIENTLEAKSRIENLKEFLSVVVDFENHPIAAPEGGTEDQLALFLESITLETDLDAWTPEEESLTLMTLHMAKGLEFPFVFMVGMEEDIFPHANSITQDRKDMEEERRLCYVGITRAKKRVTLTYASSRMLYGFRASNLPSRFLGEIPQNLIQYLGPGLSKIDLQDDDDIIFVPDEPENKKHRRDDILEF